MPILFLLACNLDALKDKVNGLTNPLAAEGLILGIAPPAGDVDISASGYEPGVQMTAFLADAASVTDLQNAPVTGADVTGGPSGSEVAMSDDGEGSYSGQTSAAYTPGATYVLSADIGSDGSMAEIIAPPGPDLTGASSQPVGQPMTLSLAGKGYTSALVIVLDPSTGTVTYSNQPGSIKDVYDIGHNDTALDSVTIPGSAFPTAGPYVYGVAGLVHTNAADLDGMNTALSSVLAGEMQFNPVLSQ
jgi:hypothetical protein